jgi:hypothetical protein
MSEQTKKHGSTFDALGLLTSLRSKADAAANWGPEAAQKLAILLFGYLQKGSFVL